MFKYMSLIFDGNVDKYTSTMDPIGANSQPNVSESF